MSLLVDDIVQAFGAVVEDAGHTLSVTVKDQPVKVKGDRQLLVQLLGNLMQNALQHGAMGQAIDLTVDGHEVTVTDQGPGIGPTEREKVLQPLYQGEQSRQGAGYGLGLSIVRAIADLHDADLRLEDGPEGKGLAVKLVFPI